MTDDRRNTETQDESPPGFRSWTSVYAVVLGCFVMYVVLLYAFTRAFS